MVEYHGGMQLHLGLQMGLHVPSVKLREPPYDEQGAVVMERFANGMRAGALTSVTWTKSSHSNATGNCVELARLPDGSVALRNSRDPQGPALIYTPDEIAAFVAGARSGDFDGLIG
ncbi:Regulatory protein [Streptomyces clavuligerus]|uniref:Regulatory protein n=2 Tax=Streptomyces clavuligerus TaxID=1901 RepID=E2Q645_STRCL|nr:Regulatory protein [Streptomyces clavuligerus]